MSFLPLKREIREILLKLQTLVSTANISSCTSHCMLYTKYLYVKPVLMWLFLACWAFTDTQWQIDSLCILKSKFGSLSSALTWPWRFAISWWISAVLWRHGDLRVHATHSHLHYFFYVGKQHRTNNKPQNHVKCDELSPGHTEKNNNMRKFT